MPFQFKQTNLDSWEYIEFQNHFWHKCVSMGAETWLIILYSLHATHHTLEAKTNHWDTVLEYFVIK